MKRLRTSSWYATIIEQNDMDILTVGHADIVAFALTTGIRNRGSLMQLHTESIIGGLKAIRDVATTVDMRQREMHAL